MTITEHLTFDEFVAPSSGDWESACKKSTKPSAQVSTTKAAASESILPGDVRISALYVDRPESSAKSQIIQANLPAAISARIDGANIDICVSQIELAAHGGASIATLVLDQACQSGDALSKSLVCREGCSVDSVDELAALLKVAREKSLNISIECGRSGVAIAAMLAALPKNLSSVVTQLRYDPFFVPAAKEDAAEQNAAPVSCSTPPDELVMLAEVTSKLPALDSWVCLDTRVITESGGSVPQELAYCLAGMAEVLRDCEANSLSFDLVRDKVSIVTSVGPDIFVEISKLRALRTLWRFLWKPLGGCGAPEIVAVSSLWNRTKDEPHVNLLRTGASALASACAGATQIELMPFSLPGSEDEALARQLAVSFQQVLRYESMLEAVTDPAGGSFYVEHLTKQLAESAWTLFQRYEQDGGLFQLLANGTLQQEVKAEAQARIQRFNAGQDVLVGLNRFRTEEKSSSSKAASSNVAISKLAKERELALRSRNPRSTVDLSKLSATALIQAAKQSASISELLSGFRSVVAQPSCVSFQRLCLQGIFSMSESKEGA